MSNDNRNWGVVFNRKVTTEWDGEEKEEEAGRNTETMVDQTGHFGGGCSTGKCYT